MGSITGKIKKQSDVLLSLLQEMAYERNNALGNDMEYQVIADTVRQHYQLVRLGWHGHRFVYFVLLHFDIKPDGKIWIQQNNTELLLTDLLAQRGVAKSEVVIGFRPEYMRKESTAAGS